MIRRTTMYAAIAAAMSASPMLSAEGEQPQVSTAPTAPTAPATPKAPKKNKPHPGAVEKKNAKPKATKAPKKAKAKRKAGATNSGETTDALREAAKNYVKDTKHKTAGGNASVHNGDAVAKKLLGKTLDEVYRLAAAALKEPESDLRKRYKHLNVGMQRMNLGNRMRAA